MPVRNQLSQTDLQVLSRIAASPDGQYLLAILRKESASIDEKLRAQDAPDVYRSQGISAWLVDLVVTLEGARDKLNDLTRDRPHRPVGLQNGGAWTT
jgi:hypothetical protein